MSAPYTSDYVECELCDTMAQGRYCEDCDTANHCEYCGEYAGYCDTVLEVN